jgi:hypothetical protein
MGHDVNDELNPLLHANERLDVVIETQVAEQCDTVN